MDIKHILKPVHQRRNHKSNWKIPQDKLERKHNIPKLTGCSAKKFIGINPYVKEKGSQINNLPSHFKQLDKEKQSKSKLAEGRK